VQEKVSRGVVGPRWRRTEDHQPGRGRAECLPQVARLGRVPAWHLALTEGASDETKARYAFVFGDFQGLHRMGLIACYYRAAEWEHTEVMLAVHSLLVYLDKSRT
jgi:hypothetical protein